MPRDATAPEVIYKDAPGFPGYRVGDDGSVWSQWKKQRRLPPILCDRWKKLKAGIRKDGYAYVTMYRDGKPKCFGVHRLVLLAHVGPCPAGMECAHDNGIPTDNRLSNIAWKTPSQNNKDKARHGTWQGGERNGRATISAKEVREIRELASSASANSIAKRYRIGKSQVSRIINRQSWSHV